MAKQRELKNIYKSMKPYVKEVAQSTLINPDFYKISLKAALAKTYDFNSYVSGLKSTYHSFYHTATLRGICEDLIVLKAIRETPVEDRSNLIMYLQLHEMFQAMRTQGRFFRKNHHQIVLDDAIADEYSDNELTKALAIYDQYGFPRDRFGPSKKKLAQRANLAEIYDFLYAATSTWVHFSPHILFRMGWASSKERSATFTYTTKHFSRYYASFNAVYGTYLFGLFCETFETELGINPKSKKYLEELGLYIGSILRWPEIITFEEMNMKVPSMILQALYSVTKAYTETE